MYVYKKTEQSLWVVGHYDSDGKWQSESVHDSAEEAARRIRYLNGGQPDKPEPVPVDHYLVELLTERVSAVEDAYCRLDKRANELEERFDHAEYKRHGGL